MTAAPHFAQKSGARAASVSHAYTWPFTHTAAHGPCRSADNPGNSIGSIGLSSDMEKYSIQATRLLLEQEWFALAIVDGNGQPTVSYIPFAIAAGAFGIVVSRLAAHSASLRASRPATVLLVDTATPAEDPYTRARFSISVAASPVAPGSASADAIWAALERRHGETVRTLHTLPDFDAIALEPLDGRLVLGFASAHDLSGQAIRQLIGDAS